MRAAPMSRSYRHRLVVQLSKRFQAVKQRLLDPVEAAARASQLDVGKVL